MAYTHTHLLADRPAVFATGCGRSGTTAMRSALSTHPSLLSTNTENNMVGDLLQACDANATVYSRRISMQTSEAEHNARFAHLMLDLLFPNTTSDDAEQRPMFATYLTPNRAERALQLFPGSRFVCMVRDGVATIESRLAHHTLGKHSFREQCTEWASWGVFYEWARKRSDCLVIRHEQLTADPVGSINDVLDFLKLPQSTRPETVLTGRRFHPTPDAERPIWQRWSEEDRAMFDEICGPAMGTLGYVIPWQQQQNARTHGAA